MNQNKPTIIVGHYGSGKTEFALNYAIRMKESGNHVVLADLDIVNPYFRSRGLKERFRQKGILIISSNFEDDYLLDVPALAASLRTCFESNDQLSIIDTGGDPVGANVLARYSGLLEDKEYNMWIVVNANRPLTATLKETADYLTAIERAGKLKVNGIINNTHMVRETTKEDIMKGDALVRQLSDFSGLKVIYTVLEQRFMAEMNDIDFAGEPFPVELMTMPKWL